MSKKLDHLPEGQHFHDAVSHLDDLISADGIPASAAKGIIYSLVETLGSIVGDPDLPAHVVSGYEGALELAREVQAKLTK